MEWDKAKHEQEKELIELRRQGRTQIAVFVVLVILLVLCLILITLPWTPQEAKSGLINVVVAIVSGCVGYFTAQKKA